jgi:hypothetical protein
MEEGVGVPNLVLTEDCWRPAMVESETALSSEDILVNVLSFIFNKI